MRTRFILFQIDGAYVNLNKIPKVSTVILKIYTINVKSTDSLKKYVVDEMLVVTLRTCTDKLSTGCVN